MQLASSFRYGSPMLRSDSPLSDDQIRRVAPSIFADGKHESRSERYTYIPTINVLPGLRNEGFQPFMVCQTRVRHDDRREFTRHMIRMRHADEITGEEANEIILLNSHDGTSSYQMLAGAYRFVCQNGMVAGDTVRDIRVPHKGNIVQNVINGAFDVLRPDPRTERRHEGPHARARRTARVRALRACAALRADRRRNARSHHRKQPARPAPLRRSPGRPLDSVSKSPGKPHQRRATWAFAQRTLHVHPPHHRHRPERETEPCAVDARRSDAPDEGVSTAGAAFPCRPQFDQDSSSGQVLMRPAASDPEPSFQPSGVSHASPS
ncbi:protein of unknown function [Paraburkholderia terricola]|uniref:DUF945 domain-containing protein n=1 Tax=Paraburkholderia terricola TaxID=169427 RepID=A0A1M6WEI1_9BURK|nr:protein of unknown function [Paraburkholderia sediminicola]SHK92182.1 protein of unknown function [Paraburkholderia terricola]